MIVVEQLQTVNLPAGNLEDTIQFYNLFFDFELIEQHEEFAILSFDNLRLKLITNQESNANNSIPTLSFYLMLMTSPMQSKKLSPMKAP